MKLRISAFLSIALASVLAAACAESSDESVAGPATADYALAAPDPADKTGPKPAAAPSEEGSVCTNCCLDPPWDCPSWPPPQGPTPTPPGYGKCPGPCCGKPATLCPDWPKP